MRVKLCGYRNLADPAPYWPEVRYEGDAPPAGCGDAGLRWEIEAPDGLEWVPESEGGPFLMHAGGPDLTADEVLTAAMYGEGGFLVVSRVESAGVTPS